MHEVMDGGLLGAVLGHRCAGGVADGQKYGGRDVDNGTFVTAGLVLRETETKESDKILTVLTPELGRISVIAKGARSRRSKYTAACQLLAYDEMTLRRKGEWYYLAEANTIELFDGVRQDIERLALAAYFAELTEAVCQDAMAAAEILPLLLNALFALGTLGKEPRLVKTAFVWRLMEAAGFAPLADGCAVCGREMPEAPMLDVMQGVLRCGGCRLSGGGLSLPLTESAVQALRYILYCPPKKLYGFTLGARDMRMLDRAGEAFCAVQLERGFRTLDYYKAFLPAEE